VVGLKSNARGAQAILSFAFEIVQGASELQAQESD
jgi:hypothetical protein